MNTTSKYLKTKKIKGARHAPEVSLGFDWRLPNTVLMALGMVVLVAGYVALSRGSETLAPVLLVTGYCGLIPAALVFRWRGSRTGE